MITQLLVALGPRPSAPPVPVENTGGGAWWFFGVLIVFSVCWALYRVFGGRGRGGGPKGGNTWY